MAEKTVSVNDYTGAKLRKQVAIGEALDEEYERICGFWASEIVDIWYEVNEDGIVGIRMDNDFGVVNGEDPIKFAKALARAAELAADFEYLGAKVVR
jgi:hypothetical protein